MPTTINGTGITFPNGTTQTTAASGAGTVTSVATGNGLQGGTITTSGTLSVACPGFNTVGSYCGGSATTNGATTTFTSGSNYSAGGGTNQFRSSVWYHNVGEPAGVEYVNNLSGTWKYMAATISTNYYIDFAVICRVS